MPFGEMITRVIRVVILDLLLRLPEQRSCGVMEFDDLLNALQHILTIQRSKIYSVMISEIVFATDDYLIVDLRLERSEMEGQITAQCLTETRRAAIFAGLE